jgi:hypothetical protein
MRPQTLAAIVAMALTASPPALAQSGTATEEQCRTMIESMLQMMKSAPMEKERDRQGANEVIERTEKMLRENRARGASECESWKAIAKIVTGS